MVVTALEALLLDIVKAIEMSTSANQTPKFNIIYTVYDYRNEKSYREEVEKGGVKNSMVKSSFSVIESKFNQRRMRDRSEYMLGRQLLQPY